MIDVGGGFRAIFGCGVMDRMLEDGIDVDMCYGVSAGAANMTSFIARQHGRNHTFYTKYRLSARSTRVRKASSRTTTLPTSTTSTAR